MSTQERELRHQMRWIIIALAVVVAIVGGFMVHWALGAIILAIFMLLFSILARA